METNGSLLAKGIAGRFSVEHAASYLGLSASTLNKMRHHGRGPRFLKIGGRIFYRAADLDTYVAGSVVETTDSRAAA